MNNQIWLMTSAYPAYSLSEILEVTKGVGGQGVEACVFRREGARVDHVATHIDYEGFNPEQAQELIDQFNGTGLRFSIGAYENLIGGDEGERIKNQNHLNRRI